MKSKPPSRLAANRKEEKHQVDDQRSAILDAAETLFLLKGLEKTTMVDIARKAAIHKVTLYRYFPNRDEIALEIHVRMMKKIAALVPSQNLDLSSQGVQVITRSMIHNFDALRDAYRYMGMFDSLYLETSADSELSQATKNKLISLISLDTDQKDHMDAAMHSSRFNVVISTVIWFLEKLAMRGELTWSDPSVPLEKHLAIFEEMVIGYIEQKSI